MDVKIGLRIVLTSAASVAIALAVGTLGFFSTRQATNGADVIYSDALVPVTQVTEIRHFVTQQRGVLNRALLVNKPDAAAAAKTKIAQIRVESDTVWRSYYATQSENPTLREMADAFNASRSGTRRQVDAMLEILPTDRAAAIDRMLNVIAPSMDKDAELIAALVAKNRDMARATYDAAVASGKRSAEVMAGTLLLGAALVAMGGFFLRRAVMRPLVAARGLAVRIRDGHLENALVVTGNDELSETLQALADMDTQLSAIVRKVRENAQQVNSAARDISAGNDDLSNRTQEQASSLEETAASMEEMAATVKQNAEAAGHTRRLTEKLRTDATTGHEVATSAVGAMGRIAKASKDIGEIAVLIDEIAFQTNLLALNAAVEAARAGEQGRGFTVVASEVRSLAQRSAAAAKDIKQLIASTRDEVAEGVGLVESTGQALAEIATDVARVSGLVAEIAAASDEQSTGVEQVNQAVSALDEVTQQNAALVEEASAASRTALDVADELMRQVSFFKLRGDASEPASQPAQPTPVAAAHAPAAAPRKAASRPMMSTPALASSWQEF
ncbi:methyl-accepting chemotaxis protein [Xanthomonas sp. NCPPB 2632]|uniref:methyl-accepting chemotaxis protein n=1 Tax=Xanthomonas sp. NCPPB 2632 TaxID=3240912 RepID=UPI003513E4D5